MWVASTVLTLCFFPSLKDAVAAPCTTTCKYLDHFAGLGSAERRYKVNTQSFYDHSLLDGFAATHGAIGAADTWNEQARAGYFTYAGNSILTLSDYKDTQQACAADGIDHSLVYVDPDLTQSNAVIIAKCVDATGVAQQFVILVAATPKDPLLDWSLGLPSAGELDLVSVLTHEFGHAVGLKHPCEGYHTGDQVEATMTVTNVNGPMDGRTRRRDLWQWDIECLDGSQGPALRPSRGRYRYFANGSLGGGGSFTTADVSQASGGMSWYLGSPYWSAAMQKDECMAWTWGMFRPTPSALGARPSACFLQRRSIANRNRGIA